MKTCPNCHKSYDDPNLNFCLDDGTALESVTNADQWAPTVALHAPPTAAATAPLPDRVPQPRHSSGALPWVVGILGVLAIVCGTGIASLIYLGSKSSDDDASNARPMNTAGTRTPTSSKTQGEAKGDVTRAQFDAIKTGMGRADVEKIMRSHGEEYYSGVGGGVSFVSVKWVGDNYKTILVSYRDDKVTSKAQVGLD